MSDIGDGELFPEIRDTATGAARTVSDALMTLN